MNTLENIPQTTSKIRLAFFAEILIEDFDGASRTMFQLIRRIPQDRFDVLFICGRGPREIEGFPCVSVPTIRIPGNADYTMAVPQWRKKKLDALLTAFAPHVVHIATPSMLGQYALSYSTKSNIPAVSIYHTHFISYVDYYLRWAKFLVAPVKKKVSRYQQRFYNQCESLYVPSKSMIDALSAGGIQADKLILWQRGIDGLRFSPDKRNTEYMRQLLGDDRPVILFASRLVWEKNLETLIRTYDLVEAQRLGYRFVVVGDGVARASCERRMPNAVFLGHLNHDDLATVYASADVFFFPSITETFGNVVLEAMASGLPCVVADGGGSRDFITDGKNGFVCPPNDPSSFLSCISSLIQYPDLARQISKKALQDSKQYEWTTLAKRYFDDISRLARYNQPSHATKAIPRHENA